MCCWLCVVIMPGVGCLRKNLCWRTSWKCARKGERASMAGFGGGNGCPAGVGLVGVQCGLAGLAKKLQLLDEFPCRCCSALSWVKYCCSSGLYRCPNFFHVSTICRKRSFSRGGGLCGGGGGGGGEVFSTRCLSCSWVGLSLVVMRMPLSGPLWMFASSAYLCSIVVLWCVSAFCALKM